MDDDSVPFEQTPEALRKRFARINPDWNKRPKTLEPQAAAKKRIESGVWNEQLAEKGDDDV
jgi:hypothetical protein